MDFHVQHSLVMFYRKDFEILLGILFVFWKTTQKIFGKIKRKLQKKCRSKKKENDF